MNDPIMFPRHNPARGQHGVIAGVSKSERLITLINGSTIKFFTLDNPNNVRGFGFNWIVVDEVDYLKEDAWEEVIQPTLMDKDGGADVYSTPKGKRLLYNLYTRGKDPEYPDWASFHFRSHDNPYLNKEFLHEMERTLPTDVFRQEILAEFLDDGAGVFRNIKANVRGALQRPSLSGIYTLGVDVAKHADFTVLTVMNNHGHIVYFDRYQSKPWPEQVADIAQVATRYNNAFIVLDSTGVGDPIFDYLVDQNLNIQGYKFTNESKERLVNNLRLSLERELLSIPVELTVLLTELDIYEYEVLPKSGKISYNAPPGKHDDCVISLTLATFGAQVKETHKPVIECEQEVEWESDFDWF